MLVDRQTAHKCDHIGLPVGRLPHAITSAWARTKSRPTANPQVT